MKNSIRLLLTLTLVLGTSLTSQALDPIKLDETDLNEKHSLNFKKQPELSFDDYPVKTDKEGKKIELGKFQKKIGPVDTGVSFNPILMESQFEAYLNLIDGYKFFKRNHDPKQFAPYAAKGLREGASSIKHIRSNTKNRIQYYKDAIKEELEEE